MLEERVELEELAVVVLVGRGTTRFTNLGCLQLQTLVAEVVVLVAVQAAGLLLPEVTVQMVLS